MGWRDWIGLNKQADPPPRKEPRVQPRRNPVKARSYDFARIGRVTDEFIRATNIPHWDITRTQGDTLRRNARMLAENAPHIVGYRRTLQTQVIGWAGIQLESAAMAAGDPTRPDTNAREQIETAWNEWTRMGVCTICKRYSFRDVQNLMIKHKATDGELVVRRIVRDNLPFGMALRLYEADHIATQYNGRNSTNGNWLTNGLEIDRDGAIVAVYLYESHPWAMYGRGFASIERVPIDELLLILSPERISQYRGVTALASVGYTIHQADKWMDAGVVAARAGASKMGFIEREEAPTEDENLAEDRAEDLTIPEEFTPGTISELPAGSKFTDFDPGYPEQAAGPFMATLLQMAASGLGVSYATLSHDLSGANYSSMRGGELPQRDFYRCEQADCIQRLCWPVYDWWLPINLLNGNINLPFRDLARWRKIEWRPRGWAWIDPQKEQAANERAVNLATRSRTELVRNEGRSIETVLNELERETEELERRNIKSTELPEFPAASEEPTDGSQDTGRKKTGRRGKARRNGKAHSGPANANGYGYAPDH